jgi:hypothetical protein
MGEKMRRRRNRTAASTGTETLSPPEDEELLAGLAKLRALLEQEDIEGARRYVQELERHWPDSERVRHHARTLAPPTVRLRPDLPNISRRLEHAWLRQHAHAYPNQWLAVLGDRLVAADPDVRVVIATVRQNPDTHGALIHFQPGSAE